MRFSALALSLTALVAPALAGPVDHHSLAKRIGSDLVKRDGRMTWYNIETGNEVACSGYYVGTDYVVAMNKPQFQSWDWCGKTLSITYNGIMVNATVVDECEGCSAGALDLTESLFKKLSGDLNLGVFYTNWQLLD
ncbi:hypothetical protein K488DRAFT_88325 [Vararia minispora EC-137]|uniref:Uncharacterized protein n=1 Tax=Vararia minispora EC-137 TaxID=1314806 RepID=A0ACB8QDK5_9AGAM|nr:hypothetical protein K488DRAFT_88325 [Vararia minispora EC-137]